jgi:hypothetical protein
MKNHELVMSVRGTTALAELEQAIARAKQRFVEMGLALGTIRDLRLYKRDYSSFEKYCRARWGCSRQHAYRLIAASVGRSNTRVTLFDQARELGKATPVGECHPLVTSEQKTQVNRWN